MNTSTTTAADPRFQLTPEELAAAQKAAARTAKRLDRFTTDEKANIVPRSLLGAMRYPTFIALPQDRRRAVLLDNLERQAAYEAIVKRTETPAPAPAPVEEKPATLARYFVSCARGCGRMLPTRSPKPVLKRCPGGCA